MAAHFASSSLSTTSISSLASLSSHLSRMPPHPSSLARLSYNPKPWPSTKMLHSIPKPLEPCLPNSRTCARASLGLSSDFWALQQGPHFLGSVGLLHGKGFTQDGSMPGYGRRAAAVVVMMQARKKLGFAELLANGGKLKEAPKRPPLRRGKVSPKLEVPPEILRPPYAETGVQPPWNDDIQIQDAEGVERMRAAGKLAAQVLEMAGGLVKPGVTTDSIDKEVHKMIIENGAYPSPLNYGRFPKSVCTSVNECICHGIPDSRKLLDGDIINIDVTVYLNGYHGDTSRTFFCGVVDDEAKKLVEVTKQSLDAAIAICGPGVEFKKIGRVINDIADKHRYGVVRHFVGHGVGKLFHSGPAVLHYRNNDPGVMQVGQTFTIEPMLTIGAIRDVMWDDKWTVVTEDGSLSAQFEHTLLITETGVEVLTLP